MEVTRNVARAEKVIRWIESKLKITIGEDAGKPFILREFQKEFIRAVYEPADASKPDRRIVRRAVLSLARKNGKSELAAALVLVHLIGPEAETNGEICAAANDREQASIVFNAVKRMVEAEPRFNRFLTVTASTKTIFVKRSDIPAKGSRFRALSAEAGTKHGLNPSLVIYDELAQAKSRELLDTLTTSQGARSQPLFLTISTQSNDPQHPLTEMIEYGLAGNDPTTVARLYAADDDCDLQDEDQWLRANPALGDFRSLDELRVAAVRAAAMPSEEQSFRLLYLNQRVAAHASMIPAAKWKACAPAVQPKREAEAFQFDRGEAVICGLDLSARVDLTALVAVSAEQASSERPTRVKSFFWKPVPYLAQHASRDRFRYDLFAQQGWLEGTPGETIDPLHVARRIHALHTVNPIKGIAYDPDGMGELVRTFSLIGVAAQEGDGPGIRLVRWGQGYRSMKVAVNALELAVFNRELAHDGNPILTWNTLNAVTIMDEAGNRKLDKLKSRFRIDGAVAMAMALGLKSQEADRPKPVDPWAKNKDYKTPTF